MKPLFPHIDINKIILSVLKFPLFLFITGFILTNIVLLPPLTVVSYWEPIVQVAVIVGRVLMGLSWVLFFYLVLASIIKVYLRKLKKEQITLSHILKSLQKGLRIVFLFFAFRSIFAVLTINAEQFEIVHKIISLFIIASIAWLVLQIVAILEAYAFSEYSHHNGKRVGISNYTRIHLIRNIVVVIVFIVAIASSLMVFDDVRNIGISLLASAGFLTAILGLAAQHSLSSLLSGIQLAFAQPFQIGDTITIESETGVVEEISMNYVKLRMSNGQQFILPINYFLQKPFRNWSSYNEGIQDEIRQSLRPNFPLQLLRTELDKIANDSPEGGKKILGIAVDNFRENNIELRITFSADSLLALSQLKMAIRDKLFEFTHSYDYNNGGELTKNS